MKKSIIILIFSIILLSNVIAVEFGYDAYVKDDPFGYNTPEINQETYLVNQTTINNYITNNLTYWNLSGDVLYPESFGYNVSIGSSNSRSLLDIQATQISNTLFTGYNNNSFRIFELVSDPNGAGTFYVGNRSGAEKIRFRSEGASYILTDVFGINTTRPAYTLDVWGAGRFTNELYLEDGEDELTPTPQLIFAIPYLDTSGNPSISHIDLYDNMYGLGISNDSFNYISGSGHNFYAYDQLANPIMTLRNNTNVGIGTKTPSAKLEIKSGTASYQKPALNVTSDDGINNADYMVYIHNKDVNTVHGNTLKVQGGAGGDTAYILDVSTYANAPVIMATGTGNVGIGTASPDSIGANYGTLTINGTNGGGVYFGKTSGNKGIIYATTGAVYTGSTGSLDTHIITNNLNRLTVKSTSGNVGIGTTSPTQKLDVRGIINVSSEIYVNNGTAVSIWLYNQSQTSLPGRWNVTGDYLYPESNSYFVGINETEPLYPLEVNGDARFNKNIYFGGDDKFYFTEGTNEFVWKGDDFTVFNVTATTNSYSTIGCANNTCAFPYDNVGIGTKPISNNRLNVVGNANVTNNFTADFYYGELYIDEENMSLVSFASEDVYINVTVNLTYDSTHNNGFSRDGNSNGLILNIGGGIYEVSSSLSFSGTTGSTHGATLGINSIKQHSCYAKRKLGATDVGNMGFTCLTRINNGDIITLMMADEDSVMNAVTVEAMNINLVRVGQ